MNNNQNKWEENKNISQKKNENKQIEIKQEDSMREIRNDLIEKQRKDIEKLKNKIGIYKITNKINNKFYIGSSSNIRDRFYVHINKLRKNSHSSIKLQSAWNKYGEENFVFDILEIFANKELLIEREQYYMDTLLFASENNNKFNELGYNIRRVAENNFGFKHSKESREKISIGNKGKKLSEERKKYLSEINKGKKHSNETRKKLSESHKGIKLSEETKKKVSIATKGENNPFYGKKHTDESKKKISNASKGRIQSKETIEKRIKASFGKRWKIVYQYDLDMNFIREWSNVALAQKELGIGHISSVCYGKRNHAGGFVWKYYLE